MRARFSLPLAFGAGAFSVFGHAPFELFPAAFVALAALAALLARADGAKRGFLLGWLWGLGAFLAGVSWLYVALHRYGGMPAPLAGLAIVLFSGYLALFPALAGALFVRLRPACGVLAPAALFAGLWLLGEWLRGWLLTGFPWLAVGYTQLPPSPLAGYFPVLGVYGVGGLVALCAAVLAFLPWRRLTNAGPALAVLLAVGVAGAALGRVAWTAPAGEPLRVALLQTNIEQGLKWQPERLLDWLRTNLRLLEENPAELVVLPETTLPLLAEQLPEGYLDLFGERMRAAGGDVVFGVFTRDAGGNIFNAALSAGRSPVQSYAKRHLVPFGEYSPPLFGWFYRLADIPMSDQTRGPAAQPPLRLGAQRVAINICYEDLFGAELLHALPEATLLLNLSNLAWYGDSFAQPQHLQIARARALETGRPMLRATNTGMTAVVLPDGSVQAVLPAFREGALHAEVRGHQGLTPYARWADWPALALGALGVLFAACRRRAPHAGKCQ
ncbi:apolipoprotein N-acyltransferase [Pseudothauera nasutitermitis]|uniref:Apolipoprotein N-acyltransferase n=1 Tax=Pseudothauera nasutitermitis TaxID=2565930 RepID=A0A4S4AWW7_9RHOO|nr:apolipoprotein N-acyltransferase [Pseudothauera nasutitermitis]THF63775.1 apolipoprotein N-acyltransferase [Pseudothauera nasutitermitis]